jgi:chromosomal replication initiator protein
VDKSFGESGGDAMTESGERSMEVVWARVSELLREKIGNQNVATWFAPAVFLGIRDRRAVLQLPNKFFVDWISEHYHGALLESLHEVCGEGVAQVMLHVNATPQGELFLETAPTVPDAQRTEASERRSWRLGYLVPKYTFPNFVVGASNKFAHAAAEAVANRPGEHYNPLFIYGGVGLGKTHLINAIGHRILERGTNTKVGYFSAEAFMNELISAIKRQRTDDFKNRFRRLDVLVIDDVQFLAGREGTQEEFFHTFNALHGSHRQIVLSSDKFPKDIPHLEDRLRNRFEWGLITDIQPPDLETRVAILLKKAEAEKLRIPHDVALFLASKFDNNIRELEGSLTRLGAFASLSQKTINVEFARDVLKDLVKDRNLQVTIEVVQRVISEQYGLKIGDLKSQRRTKSLAFTRQVAMYLSRKLTGASLPHIGEKFGNRDHSTVFHAVQVIERRRELDPAFGAKVQDLEKLIESQAKV